MNAIIHWLRGEVLEVTDRHTGLQQLRVRCDGGEYASAIHYTDELPELAPGDRVLLNGTAIRKNLGTGGVHFVYALLSQAERSAAGSGSERTGTNGNRVTEETFARFEGQAGNAVNQDQAGHIMKLRYTPLQRAVLAAEEQDSPYHELFARDSDLQGMPVLIGELHSMFPALVCRIKQLLPQAAIAYAMSDGAALPMSFSRHADKMKRLGWLNGTVTFGNAYGGDLETVNVYTALLAAKHILKSDTAVVTMGPGITGTGTMWGHAGIEVSGHIHAVHALHGVPVVIPRLSFADSRSRHNGISHHTLTALGKAALAPAIVPLPSSLSPDERETVEEQLQRYGIGDKHSIVWMPTVSIEEMEEGQRPYGSSVTTMGRGLREDAHFFAAVCAAADYVCRMLSTSGGSPFAVTTNNAQA